MLLLYSCQSVSLTPYKLQYLYHISYFSSVSRGLGELSPLSDSLLDEGLLMK